MMRTFFSVVFVLQSLVLLQGCMPLNNYEQQVQIPHHRWTYDFTPEVQFEITDTAARYNVWVILRHTHAYAYRNIWLNIATRQPGDSTFQTERFELLLQQPDGRWIGTGFQDVWEIRHPLFTNLRFRKPGTYTIRLQQIMRDNPLEHIMNAGIRVEKAEP
ncbi:MAG: gliding motility lipoprotein GldH [Lacibacter sp.]